jgi:hypothetical protein
LPFSWCALRISQRSELKLIKKLKIKKTLFLYFKKINK